MVAYGRRASHPRINWQDGTRSTAASRVIQTSMLPYIQLRAETSIESHSTDRSRRTVPERRAMLPSFEQRALLEHCAIGEDHDRGFFGVWSGHFGNFSAALE